MSRWASWLETLVLERGRVLLIVLALASLVLAAGYARLRWSSDPELITLEGSDELEFYRGHLRRWGSDELIVLAYETPDAFAPPALETLRALGGALLELEQVRWVWSLDTAFTVDTGPFGPYTRPLVPDEIRADPQLRSRALASPFVRDSLVSADGRTLVLAIQLAGRELGNTDVEQQALARIDAVLARPEFASLEPHLAGSPVFDRELARLNQRDNAIFTPLTIAIIGVLVTLLFRSLLASGLVLVIVGASVLWTQGLMGWLGAPLSLTTSLLPPLLMVIAVADSIHLLSGYLERLAAGDDRARALRWTIERIVPPCFWTSATNAFGFGSLWMVRIESVRTFATFAVLGVAIAYLLSITLLLALMVRLPLERVAARRVARAAAPWSLVFARPHPRLAAALALLALGIGAWGMPKLEVATHDGEFFADDHPLNRAYRFIEARLDAPTPFEIEIDAPQAGALQTAAAVRAISRLQDRLGAVPELTRGVSFVELLESTSPGAQLDDEAELARALFLLQALAPDELEAWVDRDYQHAHISARSDAMTSARSAEVVAGVRALGAELFPAGWSVRATGLVPVFSQMEQYLVDGQVRSYGFAVLAIGLAFLAIFRSLRLVLIALIPNLLPVVFAVGVMGLSGIRLDVVTIMVASIALGMIVDDTIHITSGWLDELERSVPPRAALEHTMRVAGRAVVFTSAIVAGGFAVLGLSDFQPTAHFGVMVGTSVAAGLLAELVILPAVLLALGGARETAPKPALTEAIP